MCLQIWIARAREFDLSFVSYFCVVAIIRTFRYSISEMLNLGIYLARESHMRLHGYLFVCCVCCLSVHSFARCSLFFRWVCLFVSQSGECSHASYHLVDGSIWLFHWICEHTKNQNVCDSRFFPSLVHSTADWMFFLLVFSLLLLIFFAQWEHARKCSHAHHIAIVIAINCCWCCCCFCFLFVHTIIEIGRLLLLSHAFFRAFLFRWNSPLFALGFALLCASVCAVIQIRLLHVLNQYAQIKHAQFE